MPDIGDPLSWYPVALSKGVSVTPLPVRVFGADYIVFRTASGEAAALSRYCLHMGADLALARVEDGTLRCKLHGWVYGRDGVCAQQGRARLKRLAVHEHAGVVFVWPGEHAGWPFPTLPGLATPRASAPRAVSFACPVHAIGLNGFDIWHYGNVHHRHVREQPQVWSDAPHHLALRFAAEVEPVSLYDKLLVRLGYSTLRVTLDYFGGNLIFVRNESGGYVALLAMAPAGEHHCRVYLGAFAEARSGVLDTALQALRLALVRRIALYFLKADEPFLSGMRPVEGLLVAGKDDVARAFWQWWRALPRMEAAPW
jgi:nitrite reductase/ring-hydroxylating ferredoxin subunit